MFNATFMDDTGVSLSMSDNFVAIEAIGATLELLTTDYTTPHYGLCQVAEVGECEAGW